MRKIRDNRWNRRFCKWMASLLMAALLVNQSSILVLAEETGADTVIVADEGTENPGAGDTDTDTETVPDPATEEEAEGSDSSAGDTDTDIGTVPDTATDEETEDFDEGEDDTGADAEVVSDMGAGDGVNTLSLDDEVEDAVSPAEEERIFSYDGVNYRIIISEGEDDRQVEVAGHVDGKDVSGTLDIPAVVVHGNDEYNVVGIGDSAFKGCDYLTSITVPDGVTSIGSEAFRDCIRLKSIIIPNSVISIGKLAFFSTKLESITIPDGITSIEAYTFFDCEHLNNITIPDGVTSIGEGAFEYCYSLTSITIPNSVTSIGEGAFEWCKGLESITIPDSGISIGAYAFSYCVKLDNITIPDGVTSIDATFRGCASLTSITIPDSVTSIGYQGFAGCASLTSITIPDSVTSIGSHAFLQCTGLKSITIPESITSIGSYTFYQCESLTNVIIPNSVTSVESHAFHYCSSLESVTILNDNISIAGGVFWNCKNLNSLQIALSENITGSPGIKGDCFPDCPKKNPLIFLTKDGTTELSETTIPKLSKAVEAYNAVNDGGINDGYWYGWKLPEVSTVPDETDYTISASAGAGGSVSPSEAKVKSGANQRFIITPEEGYRISSVLVDGVEQLNSTQAVDYAKAGITDAQNNVKYYDFENVTSNHTLAAAFTAVSTGGSGSDDSGNDDDPDDNNGGGGSGGSDGGDTGGGSDNSGGDSAGSSSPDGSGDSALFTVSDTSVKNGTNVISASNTAPASKDSEPKTGDSSHMEIYATIAMIAGLSYILLYFADGKSGMTEEEKKEIVAALVNWAKEGSRLKKYAALTVIFLVLVYYHSIGKRTSADWKEVYVK